MKARKGTGAVSTGAAKKFVFSRRVPDIPDELRELDEDSVLFASHDVRATGLAIRVRPGEGPTGSGSDAAVRKAGTLLLEGSILERVSLANSSFSSVVLKDVRLMGCDLANLETRALQLTRVEFLNCRMTGFRGGVAECKDLLIAEGDQRYAQFRFSRFHSAEFDSCQFEEADFHGSDLSGSIFRKCSFRNADMSQAKLVHADFRGSAVEGLQLNAQDIRGAVVDASQAMIFAGLLGIRIE